MKLFRRKPAPTRRISVDSHTDCGHRILELAPLHADIVQALQTKKDALDQRVGYLEEENEALVASAKTMREHMQQRIDALVDEKHRLRIQADAHTRALRMKQAELDKALAECKLLHRQLSELDAENLSLNGELSTAREEIAGLKLAVTT